MRALGIVDDLPALLAASRALIVPLWVGGGTRLKVLEGLAAARPVVGTAVGVEGIGFTAGEHGLVAETRAEQAAALDELLADPARAQRMGTAGRELAEAFRWPRALAALEATYAEWATGARKFERGSADQPHKRRRERPQRQRQTRREAGTQSHGTSSSEVSRATERGCSILRTALRALPYLILALVMFPAAALAGTPVAGQARVALDSASHTADFSTTASRRSVVILNEWERDKMLALKRANPRITVLMYKNLSFMQERDRVGQRRHGRDLAGRDGPPGVVPAQPRRRAHHPVELRLGPRGGHRQPHLPGALGGQRASGCWTAGTASSSTTRTRR